MLTISVFNDIKSISGLWFHIW